MFNKKKKSKRTLNKIATECYGFEYELEKSIYHYLCCINMKNKATKNLDENKRFNTYSQWEQYIRNKYDEFQSAKLREFSRYLNLRSRNMKPENEYLNIMLPIICTLVLSQVGDFLLNFNVSMTENTSSISMVASIIVLTIMILLCVALIIFILVKIVLPIWNNNIEENMFKDYKEVIDKMISERENQSNANHR